MDSGQSWSASQWTKRSGTYGLVSGGGGCGRRDEGSCRGRSGGGGPAGGQHVVDGGEGGGEEAKAPRQGVRDRLLFF